MNKPLCEIICQILEKRKFNPYTRLNPAYNKDHKTMINNSILSPLLFQRRQDNLHQYVDVYDVKKIYIDTSPYADTSFGVYM